MDCQYAASCPPPPPAPPHGGIGTALSIGPVNLPMTGAELTLYVLVALAMIAAGLAVRAWVR